MKNLTLSVFVVLFLTTSGNAQWQMVNSFSNGIAYDYEVSDGQLFAVTLSGIYRTDDPAMGWEMVSNGDESQQYQKITRIGDALYAHGAFTPMHRSFDNGETWETVLFPEFDEETGFPPIGSITKKGETIVAMLAPNFSAFHLVSTDNGITWTLESTHDSATQGGVHSDEDYFYLFGYEKFWRSVDFVNFEEITPEGGFQDTQNAWLAGNKIYVHTFTELLVSDDQGETWSNASGHASFDNPPSNQYNVGYFDGATYITVNNPDAGVIVSEDNGASWEFFPVAFANYPLENFTVFNDRFIGSTIFHGIIEYDDNWDWTWVGEGMTSPQFSYLTRSGDEFYFQPFAQSLLRTNDHMETFEPYDDFPGDHTFSSTSAATTCPQGAFIRLGFGDGTVYFKGHTDNEWTNITGNLVEDNLLFSTVVIADAYVSDERVYLRSNSGQFYYSNNGGQTYNQNAEVIANQGNILFHNNKIYLNSGSQGSILVSSDFGENFEQVNFNTFEHFRHKTAFGNTLCFISQSHRAISTDNGETWQEVENPDLFTIATQIGDVIIAGGAFGNVYRSDDYGQTFQLLETNMPQYQWLFNRIEHDTEYLYLFVQNGNIWKIPLSELGIVLSANDQMYSEIPELNIYPNPTQSSFNFDVTEVKNGSIQLIDLYGRVVHTEDIKPGFNQVSVESIPAGNYIVVQRDQQGQALARNRIVVIK